MQLTRESIIEACLSILNEYGLADMTMRRIATQLGVAPGAMYWHFKNKQALIDATARALLSPFLSGTQGTDATLVEQCVKLRRIMFDTRDGAELVSAALANPALRAEVETALAASARNEGAGEPLLAARTLLPFVLGASVMDQAALQQAALTGTEGDVPDTFTVDSENFTQSLKVVATALLN